MDNLECDGTEKSILNCRFDGWGKHDCKETEGAGVICDTPEGQVTDPPIVLPPKKTRIKVRKRRSQPLWFSW